MNLSREEIQKRLDHALHEGEPRQIILKAPEKYARGKDSPRLWLELKCEKHGDYEVPKRVDEATKKNGTRCKYCSRERYGLRQTTSMAEQNGSLETLFPLLSLEWDVEKNKLSAAQIPIQSNLKAWWICKRGHSFKQRVADRTQKKTSCTICQRHLRVSKFELLLYSELHAIFGKGVHSQYNGPIHSKDIDLYISPLNLAIEVDGYPWHLKTQKRDIEKQKLILADGFQLLRFRDHRLPRVYSHEVRDNLQLQHIASITSLLKHIVENFELTQKQRNLFNRHFDEGFQGEVLFNELMTEFPLPKSTDGIGVVDPISKTHPHLIAEWGDNGALTPEMVSKGQYVRVSWNCPTCGDSYIKSVHDRCQQTYGCKRCSDTKKGLTRTRARRERGINLAELFPEIAAEFDVEQNGCDPKDVGPGDGRKFWWNCPNCKMKYNGSVWNRTKKGTGCPYCSGHRVCHWNNVKVLYPFIDELWDYSRNGNKRPEHYTAGSSEKIIWTCKKCGRSKVGKISDRLDRETKTVRSFKHRCG